MEARGTINMRLTSVVALISTVVPWSAPVGRLSGAKRPSSEPTERPAWSRRATETDASVAADQPDTRATEST